MFWKAQTISIDLIFCVGQDSVDKYFNLEDLFTHCVSSDAVFESLDLDLSREFTDFTLL